MLKQVEADRVAGVSHVAVDMAEAPSATYPMAYGEFLKALEATRGMAWHENPRTRTEEEMGRDGIIRVFEELPGGERRSYDPITALYYVRTGRYLEPVDVGTAACQLGMTPGLQRTITKAADGVREGRPLARVRVHVLEAVGLDASKLRAQLDG
ncbi:MAG: hypothetical protein OXC11_14255 [Rhodospirillales bacterium]|nr:hypothetical protein [Rhodospirillales bacterium]